MKANKGEPRVDDFRHNHFDELSQNRSEFFNFFFENNDIFKMIDEEDEKHLNQMTFKYLNTTANFTFGTFASVLFTDQVLFRFLAPGYKIKGFRLIINTSKYIGMPLLGFWLGKKYFTNDVEDAFMRVSDKYAFNYYDYNKCMDVFERAEQVGRLDELLLERSKFDWTGVPQFQSKLTQKNIF